MVAHCLLRVASELPAYKANLQAAWTILPISAVTELTAVTLFSAQSRHHVVAAAPVPCCFDAKPIAASLRAGDKIGLARNGGFEQHCRGNTCIERIVRSEGHKNDGAPRE